MAGEAVRPLNVADNPNDIAARFVIEHPDWHLVLDDDGDTILIASPFYEFTREEGEQS